MTQFNMRRFLRLARWSLTKDKRLMVKKALGCAVVFTIAFLFFTCMVGTAYEARQQQAYVVCAVMVIAALIFQMLAGPAFMFNDLKGRHDDLALLMLPASNLEKYVVHYLRWVLLVLMLLGAFLVGDAVQYAANLLLDHEWAMSVSEYVVSSSLEIGATSTRSAHVATAYLAVQALWLHSLYAVGATLFRSHKYNWIFTSIAIIAGVMLFIWLMNTVDSTDWGYRLLRQVKHYLDGKDDLTLLHILWNAVVLCLTVFNFWLSYRLFCRQQLIGRFVNL